MLGRIVCPIEATLDNAVRTDRMIEHCLIGLWSSWFDRCLIGEHSAIYGSGPWHCADQAANEHLFLLTSEHKGFDKGKI